MTDDLMDLADSLTQSPARQDGSQAPVSVVPGGPVQPTSEGGRAGDPLVPGAVSGFALPDTRVPLRFGEGEHRLVGAVRLGDGNPPPPPPQPFPPNPFPRPAT